VISITKLNLLILVLLGVKFALLACKYIGFSDLMGFALKALILKDN